MIKTRLTRHVFDGAGIGQAIEISIGASKLGCAYLVAEFNPRLRMDMSMKVDKQASTAGVVILDILSCLSSKVVELVVGDVGDGVILDGL